ncbi:quinolinate synthase NadA [Halalkalibacterium ligniniphilum]|uniref:quinolinate synthase NadA n=1 Tax=Halalkalibacterium ligniniphilum TaxID=1134413 RepID=UPI000349E8D3|nr:quinolinate synthase NadA [Halalkalibacterium ligniniphilum]
MSLLTAFQAKKTLPDHYRTMSIGEKEARIRAIKQALGSRLLILGHHYQRDEVIQFADITGDSLQLAQEAAATKNAEFILFCGVHFMAETADILSTPSQKVILPDLRAGCSMADMATAAQTERAWNALQQQFGDTIIPLTYVNSTAEIKAFCGLNGGATVTSSNAKKMVEWALKEKQRILFLPDQHLGRNTAYDLGVSLKEMAIWDPIKEELETETPMDKIKVILWKGHCSVHEKFTVEQIKEFRQTSPETKIIVHPECTHEVVQQADYNGSTHFIIETLKKADSGSKWAVGTEMNLVNRLAKEHSDKEIVSLNPTMCPCLTMNRIDLDHLCWSLEQLEAGVLHHPICVKKETATYALLALNRMLERA